MTIVLCGGGSGGHITPLLAVACELRKIDATTRLVYVGEKKGKFSHIAEQSKLFDDYKYISAGKLRRYHNESMVTRLFDVKTNLLNIRDSFRLLLGTVQSIRMFRSLKADSVLLKGGYVCVPASIGAKLAGAKIVTHDSDALPGLSNRFAARYAVIHATAMPAHYYSYPQASVRQVGLPISNLFREYSPSEIRFLKEKFNINPHNKVILLTGGSNGAKRLNNWTITALGDVFQTHKNIHAILILGKGNVAHVKETAVFKTNRKNMTVIDFTNLLHEYSAVADVIISRAGATTITEFAAQSKACILVPNPDLTGGHQLKNAQVYLDSNSVIVVHEKELRNNPFRLASEIETLFNNESLRKTLGDNLKATLPEIPASESLARLLRGETI